MHPELFITCNPLNPILAGIMYAQFVSVYVPVFNIERQRLIQVNVRLLHQQIYA
jgi:hypothetical protein